MSGRVMRLDKFLADMGLGTRSEVKKLIKGGRVTVDDAIVKNEGFKVDETMDIRCGGTSVSYVRYVYYMLHKPAGVVSATEDRQDKTVLDLIDAKQRKDLFRSDALIRIRKGFCSSQMTVIWRTASYRRKNMYPKCIMPKSQAV